MPKEEENSALIKLDISQLDIPEIEYEDDLNDPLLGHVVKNETLLMFLYAGGSIAAFLYLAPTALVGAVITALSCGYLGYRDVRATIGLDNSPNQKPLYAGALRGFLPEGVEQDDDDNDGDDVLDAECEVASEPEPEVVETRTPQTHRSQTTSQGARGRQSYQATPKPAPKPANSAETGSEFEPNPWGNAGRQTSNTPPPDSQNRYQGNVYESPEDKESGTSTPAPISSTENSKFRAPSVDALLELPIKERAEELLNQLELSGCDLWSYINDPILVCQGTQQSGKSTLAVIVSVLEAALHGKRINYITSNGDIYPVAFAAIGDGPNYYSELAHYLKGLQKDQGGQDIWIVDELSKQPYETTSSVWNQLLSDFVKTGDVVRVIAHGTSAADMGLPKGRASQSKKEITILAAKRALDVVGRKAARTLVKGGRYPSGQYQLQELQGDTLVDVPEERVQLPEWLQFETYTHPRTGEQVPCYVRSLLRYFPELDTRAKGAEPELLFGEQEEQLSDPSPQTKPSTPDPEIESARSSLQGLLDAVDDDSDPLEDVSELAQKLYAWITTGAGAKLWEQRETRTAYLTIITSDNVILKGSRHRINGTPKNCHPFELADAISELVAIRKISKTKEGHVVVRTDWKSKEF